MSDARKDLGKFEAEFRSRMAAVKEALAISSSAAIEIYSAAVKMASSPIVAERLRAQFRPTIDILTAAREIDTGSWTPLLVLYAAARRADQRRMLSVVVERLLTLGADSDEKKWSVLESLGDAFAFLVLEGTVQQRFCCSLGVGLASTPAVPPVIVERIVRPLIRALITVIRIGAPRTAMVAIETTGALLKLVPNPDSEYPPCELPAGLPGEDPPASRAYLRQAERDRRIVFAIAGDRNARQEYVDALHQPLSDRIADAPDNVIETEIFQRVELLRMLPAFLRQNPEDWS